MFCGPAPQVLCCADEEGGRRHHDRQHLVRRHHIRRHYVWRQHVQQYNVWQCQSALWFNTTQRKAPQTILLNKQSCILADSHSQALYLVEFAQNEKKMLFFFHLKQDALNFPFLFLMQRPGFSFPLYFLYHPFLGGKGPAFKYFRATRQEYIANLANLDSSHMRSNGSLSDSRQIIYLFPGQLSIAFLKNLKQLFYTLYSIGLVN